MKIALLINYDGTAYNGWQRQSNGIGIQEIIEDALKIATGEDINLSAAGRTDAGVHAEGQVADFTTNSTIPADRFKYPLNNNLPADIRILESKEVDEDFSARFDAKEKHYRYTIYLGEVLPSTIGRYAALYDRKINLELIKAAASAMEGTHDFKAFEGPYAQMATSVRTVNDIIITQDGNYLFFDIYGEAFLKNMIRIMVGTILKINEGRMDIMELMKLFQMPDRTKAGITMPANGLTMVEVFYDNLKFDRLDY